MTVQGMQQQSHSTPSPHGQEMHGFVDPLIGFDMVEMTDEDVEGGIVNRLLLNLFSNWSRISVLAHGLLTCKRGGVAAN
jgi:hypothetical protein